MADHLGSFNASSTIYFYFTTHAASGAAVAPSSAFEAADLVIYKNGSATQRTSASGITMTSPFDSVTGLHAVAIDLSDNTDAGFYAAGAEYVVVLSPDETVDSLAVVKVLAYFSIERVVKVNVTQYGGTAGAFSGGRPEVNVSHLLGTAWLTPGTAGTPDVNVKLAGGTAWASGAITAAVFAADAITANAIAADAIGASELATGAVSEIAAAVWDLAISGHSTAGTFGAQAVTILNAQTTQLDGIVTDTEDIQSRLPATLVSGRIDASVGAMATDVVTATALAASAVTEIAAGISIPTAAAVADAVWDELLSGHLTDGSFGAVLNAMGLHSGAVFSATSSTVRLAASGPSATNDTYNGCWVAITSGTGIGQARLIYDYVGASKACSITPDWITTPANNDTYVVLSASSINAVYGAVGSVAGNVDGSVATAMALGVQAKADVNAEVVDALATDTYAEPGQGTPSATLSLSAKIGYLFKAWRNKSTQTSTAYNLYNDDAATVDQKATASDDGTTFSRTEITTGP